MRNHQPNELLKKAKFSMDDYDNLPSKIRNLLADSPYCMGFQMKERINLTGVLSTLKQVSKNNIIKVYGPDHPNAVYFEEWWSTQLKDF